MFDRTWLASSITKTDSGHRKVSLVGLTVAAHIRRMESRPRRTTLNRTDAFCQRFGLRVPILLAPMAGACPPSLSVAVASAGGLGACGALLMQPGEIRAWADEV